MDPDIVILKEPVTFSDNLFEEFESKISPSEKDSIVNIYFKKINEIDNKYGFKIYLLNVRNLDIIQARKDFYRKNINAPNFKLKVEMYKKLNEVIEKKIKELNLKRDIFSVNSPVFDDLKEIEGEYFSSIFGEELGVADYKKVNERYINKILEIIKKNKRRKILIIYDSNQKYELINSLVKLPDVSIIRVKVEE